MNQFISICCEHDTTQAVIDDCARQLAEAPAGTNFGFVYATDAMAADYPALLARCKHASGIAHWVGTVGYGVIATGREIYDRPAASILLAEFNDDEFTIVPAISHADEIAAKLQCPREYDTHFGIIHGNPFNQHTQPLIEAMQQQLANGFLVGGLTSSRGRHYQAADEVSECALSGAVFSEKIGVVTGLSQGCSPVGDKHTVSQSQDNVALLLDDRPALDVLMQDMQIRDPEELEHKAGETFVGLCLPGSDLRDYTVRNLIGIDLNHRVFAINDDMVEGNQILFCRRNAQTAIDDMQHMLDNLSKRLKQKPHGGLYVSCLGRGREQFGDDSEEIRMIHDRLGKFPLTGFFANGEIHHRKLYGYTGVLTLFI